MTTPGGVPNLPQGALTIDTLADKTQDMSTPAMRARAAARFPNIFNSSTGGNALNDLTPIGIITQIFSGFNSVVANADPDDVQGPEDLPGMLLDFIESLPVVGELIGLLEAITGTYAGDDPVLLEVQTIFAPIRAIVDSLTGLSGGLGGLGSFFPDLLGLLGNPTGMGTGTPVLGSLSSIPLFGPLFSLFGGATSSTQASNFFTNLLSLLGGPGLTGSTGSFDPVTAAEDFITNVLNPTGLLASIEALVEAITGSAGGLEELTSWANDIPVLGTVLDAVSNLILGGGGTGDGLPVTLPFTLGARDPLGVFFGNIRKFLGDGDFGDGFDISSAAEAFIENVLRPAGIFDTVETLVDQLLGVLGISPTGTFLDKIFDLSDGFDEWFGDYNNLTGNFTNLQDLTDGILGNIFSAFGFNTANTSGDVLTDLLQALTNIPGTAVRGAGGQPNVVQTFTSMWDTLAGAFRRFGVVGVGLDDVGAAAQDTAASAADAYQTGIVNQNTLAIRTNQPVMGALERTTVSNMPLTALGTGATPTNFAVTQAASGAALIRMPESDTKGVVYYRCTNSGTISGFYLNFGKMALDGSVAPLFSSADQKGQLTGSWGWKQYTFPGASQIIHNASEVIVAEFQVVGSGTVTVAGQPLAWMTDDHPVATTKRSGITRNTGGSGPSPLSIASGSVTFTGNTPYVGLGRSTVPPSYVPPEPVAIVDSGAFTYTIPGWIKVGDIVDYFLVGAGGGGQSGGYFGVAGEGGLGGNWSYGSLVYGTDIPVGTTQLTGTVAGAASGGINAFLLEPGNNGGSTVLNGVGGGFTTRTATGGLGGGRTGNNNSTSNGLTPGNRTIGDYTAWGGATVGGNTAGNAPGGGGGGGWPAIGHESGKGRAWFRARQA